LTSGLRQNPETISEAPFLAELRRLKIQDTPCLIYENTEEWRAFTVNYIKLGLERGDRCYYVYDAHSARQVRDTFKAGGIDVISAESSGQLVILHGNKLYIKNGIFDPNSVSTLLIEEAQKSRAKGYTSLRLTFEMDWLAHHMPGSEKVQEFKANLIHDFFLKYPCSGVYQYDRRTFSPEEIKEAILTHSVLIQGNHVYSNFYHIPPEKYLNNPHPESETQYWLNHIKRENDRERELQETSQRLRMLFEQFQTHNL
jgi:hypothetical protein